MKAALVDELEKPLHPSQLPEIQHAKATMQAAARAAVEAQRRHEDNHRTLHNSPDEIQRWKAQAAAGNLLSEMLGAKAAAREAETEYQALLERTMVPVREYWRRVHRQAVAELCEALRGDVLAKNTAVLNIIRSASADDVSLAVMTSLPELEPQHVDFTIQKLLENAG